MALLENLETGLAFDLRLLGRDGALPDGSSAGRWIKSSVGFFAPSATPFFSGHRFTCCLLASEVEALCSSLCDLLDGGPPYMTYFPLEPAFRIVVGPSRASGFVVPEPWGATVTLDTGFLGGGAATGSGPALSLMLEPKSILRFVEELEGEYQMLASG